MILQNRAYIVWYSGFLRFLTNRVVQVNSNHSHTTHQEGSTTRQSIWLLTQLNLWNEVKTEYMRINPNFDPLFIISIKNTAIIESNVCKILGIMISNHLSLNKHYKTLRKNAFWTLNILKSIADQSNGTNPKICIDIYKALIKSKLNFVYCIINNKKLNTTA